MQDPQFYLGKGRFTSQGDMVRYAAGQIKGDYAAESVSEFVKRLAFQPGERIKLFRKRTSDEIIKDGFVTGCTDAALVFCSLLRARGIPAAYVETLEEDFLWEEKPVISGHVFSDVYQGGIWVPFNPGNGKTIKTDNTYIFLPDVQKRYIEKGRGLDFSRLYPDDSSDEHFQLRSINDMIDYFKLK